MIADTDYRTGDDAYVYELEAAFEYPPSGVVIMDGVRWFVDCRESYHRWDGELHSSRANRARQPIMGEAQTRRYPTGFV